MNWLHMRKVPFSFFMKLLKNRKPFTFTGTTFLILSVFILFPGVYFLSNAFLEPYQKYDFDKIEKHGIEQPAKVLEIKPVKNVTVNEEHPLKISYEYISNGNPISDKFQTMDLDKASGMNAGSEIKIKVFENQSVIQDLKPFIFPYYWFYLLPLAFLLAGLLLLFVSVLPALRDFNLYKYGIVKEGVVISLFQNSGFPFMNFGKSVFVNYAYWGSTGEKIIGESKTDDLSVLSELKEGDKIKLFVSAGNENRSCLVPKREGLNADWML
jgi:hypothetical protein